MISSFFGYFSSPKKKSQLEEFIELWQNFRKICDSLREKKDIDNSVFNPKLQETIEIMSIFIPNFIEN